MGPSTVTPWRSIRSKDIIARKEREARTNDQATLVNDEKQRQRRHEAELRRALKSALLDGYSLLPRQRPEPVRIGDGGRQGSIGRARVRTAGGLHPVR